MENKGKDFYTVLKKYNRTLWAVVIIAAIAIGFSAFQAISIYDKSTKNLYGISEKGNMVPMTKLEDVEGQKIQAKANIEHFINQYYELDGYTMKRKRERVFWLVGEQPTQIIKDRASKGYFDMFLSMQGLTQTAYLLQNTLQLSDKPPYQASFIVRIKRINAGQEENYNAKVNLEMVETNRNYPFNPYGLLITKFSEDLEKVTSEDIKETLKKDEDSSNAVINQNPKTNGTK